MRVEPDEHEFMLECGHEIVISSILAVFVIVLMCVFVCLDSQYCIVYQYAVVDASTVIWSKVSITLVCVNASNATLIAARTVRSGRTVRNAAGEPI